jgi:hypothetical protein
VVGEVAEREAGQALTAKDDPDQGRGEQLDRFDPSGEQGAVTGAGFVRRCGGDLSCLS